MSASHVVEVGSNTYELDVYITGVDSGVVGQVTGPGEQLDTNVVLDIDLNRGDLIRVKARQTAGTGTMSDPIIKLFLKWRLV